VRRIPSKNYRKRQAFRTDPRNDITLTVRPFVPRGNAQPVPVQSIGLLLAQKDSESTDRSRRIFFEYALQPEGCDVRFAEKYATHLVPSSEISFPPPDQITGLKAYVNHSQHSLHVMERGSSPMARRRCRRRATPPNSKFDPRGGFTPARASIARS